ncbi:MAG: AAA family ATPase [Defluviitaleaceae bacterium]|nr:AAA family ATPase [Defluviitaleaceae bacterium]
MTTRLDYTQLKNFEIERIVKELAPKLESEKLSTPIIGQTRATEAINFGLTIDAPGYNIYLAGESGLGKATAAHTFASEKAKNRPTPPDICYVYNFTKPKEPVLIQLPPGQGKQFKKDMAELVDELLAEIPQALSAPDFEESKNAISKNFGKKRDEIMKYVSKEARKYDFEVKPTNTGVYFMPIVDGKPITEEEFGELKDTKREEILEKSAKMHDNMTHIMGAIRELEVVAKTHFEELEFTRLLFVVGKTIGPLFERYIKSSDILSYLKEVREDILSNPDAFLDDPPAQEDDVLPLMPWSQKKDTEDPLIKYKVNIVVDNSSLQGAPVITNYNPTYYTMVGEVEYDSDHGNFNTDFMKIRPGLLHRANGGYLILRANDINMFAMEAMLRTLKTREVVIEPIKELQTIPLNSINPQKLTELDVKVILLGDFYLYDILQTYEEDFRELFKIRGDFDYEMTTNEENIQNVLTYITNFAKEKEASFTKTALVAIMEHVARLGGRKDKLTSNFNLLAEILQEAVTRAKLEGDHTIDCHHIKKTLEQRRYRNSMYEDKLTALIEEEIIMIDTTGSKVGQVNGLAVIDLDEYAFAKPTKITATSYAGKSGVINIEKEARLSGRVHDKGVQVLAGYLGNTYAKEFPLAISIRIAFEQNYAGIDGDSASSAELFAIISSIAEIPLSQELAVTGSLNQFGESQAIGGATEKIEGFFDICAKRGLTGNQGVIIPIQNVADLLLKNQVIEAVQENKFHIYPISNIDQGIELLTGATAEKVHKMVKERLKLYSEEAMKEK